MVVLSRALPGLSPGVPESLTVNGAGAFEVGGPEGDNGLSGKKLVMDAYGPRVPIGGGAWSGKDFFKADRAGGLHARRLAKLAVRIGLAEELRVTLGWFPGDRSARLLSVEGGSVPVATARSLPELTDLTLAYSGTRFGAVDDLVEIARLGHFATADLPWEAISRL
jgi:S-adenosylmethionine synthetase